MMNTIDSDEQYSFFVGGQIKEFPIVESSYLGSGRTKWWRNSTENEASRANF